MRDVVALKEYTNELVRYIIDPFERNRERDFIYNQLITLYEKYDSNFESDEVIIQKVIEEFGDKSEIISELDAKYTKKVNMKVILIMFSTVIFLVLLIYGLLILATGL